MRPVLIARKVGFLAVGAILLFYVLFPIFWLVLASFKSADELARLPVTFWPDELNFSAYRDLFEKSPENPIENIGQTR